MITGPDFEKKQIVFVFPREGEKIALSNSNFIVKKEDDSIKFQCTCYRLFLVVIVGHCSITTPIIQASYKFGFFFALFTNGFKFYSIIGPNKDGNTLLKQKQYNYAENEIGKRIQLNKIYLEYLELKSRRNKTEEIYTSLDKIKGYYYEASKSADISSIMAFEGLSAKLYFKIQFDIVDWNGRQPRIKKDIINLLLDIGYTLLFSFIDALLSSFGFDTFIGIFHKAFYLRKSLVCDIIEPFRIIVDKTIRKAYNLGQIDEEDFIIVNHQYQVKYDKSSKYSKILMLPIIENKDVIFDYIESYYRHFMKESKVENFPLYIDGEIKYDFDKL